MPRLPRSISFGVFATALSIILLQIALTRIFAVMMWHHLTYMVVSIALLGFGAAGSLLTAMRAAEDPRSPVRRLTVYTAGYGVAVLIAFFLLRTIEVDCFALWTDKRNLLALLLVYAITTAPFLLGGMALGLALTRYVQHVNRLYFVDLVGSGLGGAISVWLLGQLSASTTVVLAAAIGLAAAAAFGATASGPLRWGSRATAALGAIAFLISSGFGQGLGLPHLEWHPPFAAGKDFAGEEDDPELVRLPSATAEVEVGRPIANLPMLGGDIGYSAIRQIEMRNVGQDGTAPTFLFRDAGQLERFDFLTAVQAASAYVAAEAAGMRDPRALVIGVGGGIDVMIALLCGARHVTAVELNTAMIEAVTERFADYLDHLFTPGAHTYSDRIQLVNSEGRSFMRSRDDRYDVIQMSGVDSFTALSTGAYTLSESYLYTVEAVTEFYEHLEDGGYISYSRFILQHPKKPRETLRLANIARQALAELGVADPARQIAVFQGRSWASTMIKRGAFTRAEIDALQEFGRREGFLGLVFDPLLDDGVPAKPALDSVDLSKLLDDATLDSVLEHNAPGSSAEQRRPWIEPLLAAYRVLLREGRAQADSTLATTAETTPELAGAARRALAQLQAQSRPPVEAFAATAEIFRSVLTSGEADRAAFLRSYPYDLSPCTDDTPFFFNYYKYGALLAPLEADATNSVYTTDVPIGHVVLLASLTQVLVLAVVLIFLPLRRLSRAGIRTAGSWRYFCYFAALGAGFMFVEIVVMQKMVIFLGHPTYALSVVLAALLVAAGTGSLVAGRIHVLSRRNLIRLGAAIVAAIAATCAFQTWGLDPLLGLPLPVRIGIAVAAQLPVGIALGMAFPTGMRVVEQNCPQLLPWCWAINGFLSVFSAVFVIVLSMIVGFTVALLSAALIYAAGFAVMPAARTAS